MIRCLIRAIRLGRQMHPDESIRRRVARKAAEAASDNLVSEAAGTACERKL
jgi:hypothetical protein